MNQLDKNIEEVTKKLADLKTKDATPKYKVPDESSDKASKDAEKSTNKAKSEHKKLMEDYKRRADEAGKLSVELTKEIKEKK